MKRVMFAFIFVLLVSGLVVAAENDSDGDLSGSLGELGDISVDSSGAKDKSNDILAKEIDIPESLEIPARVVFGLKGDDKIDLQTFIVLIGLWIILLLVIKSIVEVVPMFDGGIKSWIAGIVITLLIAVSGAIRSMALFFFGFGGFFGLLEDWGILQLVFALVILVVVFFALSKVIRAVKKSREIGEAEETGDNIGYMAAVARRTRKIGR